MKTRTKTEQKIIDHMIARHGRYFAVKNSLGEGAREFDACKQVGTIRHSDVTEGRFHAHYVEITIQLKKL